MKRIVLIILLSFLSVTGVIGLTVGGMYLFGGFEEQKVYAESIEFNKSEVVKSTTFALKITTPTEGVNQTKLRLYTNNGFSSNIIDFPEYVEIGKIFFIVPKQENGINLGGNVTLYAGYDTSSSNQIAPAKCEILIDVPVETVTVNLKQTQTEENVPYTIAVKGESINNLVSFYPQKSLMPYIPATQNVSDLQNKKIFLELTDEANNALSTSIAQFFIDDGEKETAQLTNVIELKYHYDGSQIVFDESIKIRTKNQIGDAKLNAYVYSTYEKQSKDLNAENEIVFSNSIKTNMNSSLCLFTIGSYTISGMTCNTTDKNVLLDLNEDSEFVKIYVNNPNATGKDINLGVELQTESVGVVVGDAFLQNLYLKIDNNNYRLFNNGSENDEQNNYDDFISFYYSGLSKSDWCWKLKLNKFLGYYNYTENETPFVATLKYIEYVKDNSGNNTSEVKLELSTKTFNIIPVINETTSVNVKYEENEDTSFKIKSGESIDFIANSNKYEISPENATFKDLTYYLSYAENDSKVNTIPKKLNKNYKATFSFTPEENITITNALTCFNTIWCNISSVEISQGNNNYTITYSNNVAVNIPNNMNFDANVNVNFVVYFKLTQIPTEDNLFKIELGSSTKTFSNFEVKFYEYTENNVDGYDLIPYLEVNGIRTYLDYDFYFDDDTNSKYLKINFDVDASGNYQNLNTVSGIGSFVITAQLTYTDNKDSNNEKIYWLDKFVNINIDCYEDLEDLIVYNSYAENTLGAFSGFENNKISLNFNENNSDKQYIYLTSSTFETLKNYISNNQITILVTQVFDELENVSNYTNIYNKNKNAITFDSNWVEVLDSGDNIVAYKIGYTINEVYTMKIDGIFYEPKFNLTIKARVNGVDKIAEYFVGEATKTETLEINVTDKLLTSATLKYNGYSYTEESPLKLVATVSGNGVVSYTGFDNSKLEYYFTYNDESSTKTAELLKMEDPVCDVMVDGIYSFVKSNECKGGLTLGNFPRKKDSNGNYTEGVKLKLKISANSEDNINTYYNYNTDKMEKYNLTDELWLNIFGLVVEIENNSSVETVYGKKDTDINLFGTNGLFKVTIKSGENITESTSSVTVSDYSKILTVYYSNDSIDSSILSISNDFTKLTSSIDFVDDKDITFKFYVGSNYDKNLIKVGSLKSSTRTIKSPFVTNVLSTNFEAPSSNNQFITLKYGEDNIDFTKTDIVMQYSVVENSITLDSSYNIANLITITDNANNKTATFTAENPYTLSLSFKEIPENCSAQIKVILVLTVEGTNYPKEIVKEITISNKFSSDDLIIGTNDEMTAGQTYSVGSGITLSGLFTASGENWRDKITSVEIDFIDTEESPFVECNKHMQATSFSKEAKTFSITSNNLHQDKEIKCKFLFIFTDGGKTSIEKNITIKKNLSLKFAFDALYNNEEFAINDNSSYVLTINNENRTFDISNSFMFKANDDGSIYNEDSFVFDTNVFNYELGRGSGIQYYLTVKDDLDGQGGSAACQGKTTITVNYAVFESDDIDTEKNVLYTLPIEIPLNIYPNNLKIGNYNTTTQEYSINCGEDNKVDLTNGIVFAGNLLTNKNSIKSVNITFEAIDSSKQTLVDNLMHYNVAFTGEETNKTFSNIELYALDYNEDIDLKIITDVEIGGNHYYFYQLTTLKATNFDIKVNSNALTTTDEIDLTDKNNFTIKRNNVDLTDDNLESFIEDLTFEFDTNVFEIVDNKLKVKESFVSEMEGSTVKKNFIVKKTVYSGTKTELYSMSFTLEITITKA